MSLRVIANVGAEEDRPARPHPAVTTLCRLFALLFPAGATCYDANGVRLAEAEWRDSDWPEDFGPGSDQPAFAWIEGDAHAWLVDASAAAQAEAAGSELAGPSVESVARVHDKAFTRRVCQAERLAPRCLRGTLHVLEPEALAPVDDAIARIQSHVDAWPEWMGGRFALKPRIGGSGRGRVGGQQRVDTVEIRRALPRLARRGGVVLEPWLDRLADLSTQLHVAPDGALTLLATFQQLLTRSGVFRGHRAQVDHRGRITSGTRYDDALLEAATTLARAAHGEGFHGPCGVDAFVFRGPDGPVLHPAVELNARFTTGTVVAGLVRRAWPRMRSAIDALPGQLRAFRFGLDAPPGGWPGALTCVPLWTREEGPKPALAFAANEEALKRALGPETLE